MNDKLIELITAKLAKEIKFGYDFGGTEYVPGFYSDDSELFQEIEMQQQDAGRDDYYIRPSQSVLQTWLRENYNIHVLPKPIFGSKNGYDSFPMIGWSYDVLINNKETKNSYYLGYPILDWFTAILEKDEKIEDLDIEPLKYEEAFEKGLIEAINYIINKNK